MRKIIIASLLCTTLCAFSQSFHVGDSVMVNPSVKQWMTGEPISSWVYLSPHPISQVGSSYHPNGLLLNVKGARSWIKEDEVTKSSMKNRAAQELRTDTVVLHDTIVSIQEKERIVPIHDTVFITQEIEKERILQSLPDEYCRFQFYGDLNQYFGPKNYGAGIAAIFGARLTEYAFVGGGLEFGYWMAGQNAAKSMEFPVFVHSRIYIPVNEKYYPHIEMSLGANMGYRTFSPDVSLRPSGFHYGVYAKGGIGIDLLKCLSLGVGYQYGGGFSNVASDLHHTYIKIGLYVLK